jgi:hypothetical protein
MGTGTVQTTPFRKALFYAHLVVMLDKCIFELKIRHPNLQKSILLCSLSYFDLSVYFMHFVISLTFQTCILISWMFQMSPMSSRLMNDFGCTLGYVWAWGTFDVDSPYEPIKARCTNINIKTFMTHLVRRMCHWNRIAIHVE